MSCGAESCCCELGAGNVLRGEAGLSRGSARFTSTCDNAWQEDWDLVKSPSRENVNEMSENEEMSLGVGAVAANVRGSGRRAKAGLGFGKGVEPCSNASEGLTNEQTMEMELRRVQGMRCDVMQTRC